MPAVFISYSRRDKAFVQRLHDALTAREYDVWVDWEDIPPSAEWFSEIQSGIRGADGVIYVITPDSAASEICTKELDTALDQNKRVVPVVHREPGEGRVPEQAASLNWVFLRDDDDFDAGLATLITALETDLDHVRVHTRLGVQAGRWQSSNNDRSQLLRGSDLTAAEQWLVTGAGKQPEPTQLQREYILASRQAATRRQRTVIGAVSGALVIAVALAIVALVQRSTAVHERNVAYARQLDADALNSYSTDPELSLLLATKATEVQSNPQTVTALRAALAQSNVRARYPLDTHDGGDVLWSPNGTRLLVTSPGSGAQAFARIYTPGSTAKPITLPGPSARHDSAWDAAGNEVAIGGAPVSVYDAATGHLIRRIAQVALRVGLTADGSKLVTVDLHSAGHVFDVRTGRELARFTPKLTAGTNCFALSPNGRYAAQCDNRSLAASLDGAPAALDVWNTSTGKLVRSVPYRSTIGTVAFSPDSRRFVMTIPKVFRGTPAQASENPAAQGNAGTLVYATTGHGAPIKTFPGAASAAVFSPDPSGRYPALAYATLSGAEAIAYVYQFYSGRTIPLTGAQDVIETINFDDGGGYVVTGGRDNVVRVYASTSGGAPIETLAGHQDQVVDASFGANDTYVASSSDDGTARLWQGPTPAPVQRRTDAPLGDGATAAIAFTPDGSRIVQTGGGDTISGQGRILNATTLAPMARFAAPTGQVFLGQAAGRQGPLLTMSEPEQAKDHLDRRGATVESYSLQGGGRQATITPAAAGPITNTIPSHDGSELITLQSGGRAAIWNARTGRLLHPLAGAVTPAVAGAFSADGRLVAIAHYPRLPAGVTISTTHLGPVVVQLFAAATGRLVRTITGPALVPEIAGQADYAPLAVTFSPDGRMLAVSGADPTVRIYDPSTGALTHTLPIGGLSGGSYAATLAFSPDGHWLAGGSGAGAYLWRVPSFQRQPTLQHVAAGSASAVIGAGSEVFVGFTRDSQYLETLGDNTLGVWDVSDQQEIFHDYPVTAGSIDAGATRIVTATALGVSVYPCELCGGTGRLLALAKQRATRGLTPAERERYLTES